ncbi:MAG: hypothetical protein HY246_07680 [Proteobacteria bacterium]|nr:hypothetical protein [Pseudomonadota bacterium]
MTMPYASTSQALQRVAAAMTMGIALALSPAALRAEVSELRIGVQFGLGYLPVYVAREAGLLDKRMREAGLVS